MFKRFILILICFLLQKGHVSGYAKIDALLYEGGFNWGFKWFYPLPTVSDGDLQYGTALTLTGPPLTIDETQNLSARVKQIDPHYTSAYRINLGYAVPCTNANFDLEYFSFRASNHDSVTSPIRNALTYQFLQNFLGGGFVSGDATDTQRIDQIDLTSGNQYLVDKCVIFYPFFGVSFAYIKRTLDVSFHNFVIPPFVNPAVATLTGSLKSSYWGFGPTFGVDFSFPIFGCLGVTGRLGLSALGGNVFSKISSNSIRGIALTQEFSAEDSNYRITPIVRSDIGLNLTYPICNNRFTFDLTAGYEVDYYFRVVDRVNPDDGYVNNPGSTPKTTISSIGLGGPYAQIALKTASLPSLTKPLIHMFSTDRLPAYGWYLNVENSWLEPTPTSKDLTYAILHAPNGSSEDQKVVPDHSWSGSYHLGYYFPCNVNLDLAYRYFHNEKRGFVTAGPEEGISSLNASGPSGVLFSNAQSRVKYTLHQFDLSLGKWLQFCDCFNVHGFTGLRALNLERTLHNIYTGGDPSTLTESKFPILKSNYWGLGPLMGFQPTLYICPNFGFTGLFDLALLVGSSKSKLDQLNRGTLPQETSNTLRTRNIQTIVPIIDTKIGLFWRCHLCRCLRFDIEAGYFFSEYFKAIDLVFPNLLTGLGQKNSSLLLSGPYITLSISGF